MSISRHEAEQLDYSSVVQPSLLDPVTTGEVLREEFILPLGLSARGITADTAILLGQRFNTTPRFWVNLQVSHDLAIAARSRAPAA